MEGQKIPSFDNNFQPPFHVARKQGPVNFGQPGSVLPPSVDPGQVEHLIKLMKQKQSSLRVTPEMHEGFVNVFREALKNFRMF